MAELTLNLVTHGGQERIEYMRMAGRELEKRPVADTVLQPELLEWVGYRVNECCCRRALADIQIFNRTIFSKAIEYVTSKVELPSRT